MSRSDRADRSTTAEAQAEQARLQSQIELARAELARLRRLVGEEERRLNSKLLVEANEQMVASTLRAHRYADTIASQLEEVSRSAELDGLTGLPNRALMLDRLRHAIAQAKRRNTQLALLFLDLDNFKQVNDRLGHATGDQAIQWAAQCLLSAVREGDTVSRQGGDEFLILLDEVSGLPGAMVVANKVITALNAPHQLGDHSIRLQVSIGISVYPDDGEDDATLIARADAAMYVAKRQAGSSIFHFE